MTIIIGTGPFNTFLIIVSNKSSKSSWSKAPEFSTSENGKIILSSKHFLIGNLSSGVHHKKTNCDSNTGLDKVKSIISSAKKSLFPEKLQFVVTKLRKKMKEKKPNGGWSDKRDHDLCLNFTQHK